MNQEVSLEQAVAALRRQYGSQYEAGFEQGKADMSRTLESALGISGAQAGQALEALIQAHTIQWQSQSEGIPNQQGTMGMVVEQAYWDLGE